MADSSFSRSGFSNPLGKLYPMPKVCIADPTKAVLVARAAEAGMPYSEYVRIVLEGHAHGPEHVARLAADRIRAVLAMGVAMGPEED
jgi:hypothetical protein